MIASCSCSLIRCIGTKPHPKIKSKLTSHTSNHRKFPSSADQRSKQDLRINQQFSNDRLRPFVRHAAQFPQHLLHFPPNQPTAHRHLDPHNTPNQTKHHHQPSITNQFISCVEHRHNLIYNDLLSFQFSFQPHFEPRLPVVFSVF